MKYPAIIFILTLSLLGVMSCTNKDEHQPEKKQRNLPFDPKSLIIKENSDAKKLRGQVLYIPVYSNVPYHKQSKQFDLSAFVAIHNTDLNHPIRITKVLFFNNDGKLVANYLPKPVNVQPLGSTNYFIPEKDQSGTGANFLVEWMSDIPVNEPLIESVMLGLTHGQGVSFSSTGKVIREMK
ncbi:DUF3124 domain-containing protein [Parabacteroides sp. FAFU027]|uniref:DUF3124 domain-containing protein n=1 Tax=Parabacteroides sp. FAFU027 TaxID=2922715 RepID=UPI001FB03102|nr:DUF3124 domain-containing protein [Parabacteroides sp. FAFU027]